jgi:hypothetical protein
MFGANQIKLIAKENSCIRLPLGKGQESAKYGSLFPAFL